MNNKRINEAIILGAFFCIGLVVFGYLLAGSIMKIKALDRTVTVKGLSEREVTADIAIWPLKFTETENDLGILYAEIERKSALIYDFLKSNGFSDDEISQSAPAILDRQAQGYVDSTKIKFRYSACSTLTVYTKKVDSVRSAMKKIMTLGKQGIAIAGQDYQTKTEFLFTRLNQIKPQMVQEATKNARQIAQKFAKDSESKIGKLKHARQGQFSIKNRDSNTPYIKKVRVVSTLVYYLSD